MTTQNKGILYLIPTLLAENTIEKSITPHLKAILQSTSYFIVENVRTARRFISALKLDIDIESLDFKEINKRTRYEEISTFLTPLKQGKNVGLMSEAGCPAVADPGSQVVALAHALEIEVSPLVGPSSILLGLMASGFNGQSFTFHGYLPIDAQKRNKRIKSIEKRAIEHGETQIFMETPFRNNQLLKAILANCRPETLLCIARDLTADNEWICTRKIMGWKKQMPDLNKKPTMFILSAS